MVAAETLGLPIARLLQRSGLLAKLPGPLARWSARRDLPPIPTRALRRRWPR
jgi:hypothetical protein